MKKLLISASLFGLFILFGNNICAQTSKAVTHEIDTDTKTAISTIKEDKALKDAQKEKFILRIEAFAKAAKKNDDTKAKEIFEKEYKRIADNYNRVTGNSLPKITKEK
jgi:hypothetical protein